VAVLIVVCLAFYAMYSCERWKWRECRSVGHSVLYCLDKQSGGN